ncbi:MAG: hypothetical protein IID39_00985 [Planctomycetes bacterium]|nr:hypothetical protein [Planctomycetota bacterium]
MNVDQQPTDSDSVECAATDTGKAGDGAQDSPIAESASGGPSRRALLRKGAKVLVYAAPLVQLVRPQQVMAGHTYGS